MSWQWDLVQDVTDGLPADGSNDFGAVVKLFNDTLVVTSPDPDRFGGTAGALVVSQCGCVIDVI